MLTILAIIVVGYEIAVRYIFRTVIVYASGFVVKRIPVIGDINGLSYVFSGVLIIVVICSILECN